MVVSAVAVPSVGAASLDISCSAEGISLGFEVVVDAGLARLTIFLILYPSMALSFRGLPLFL